MKAVNNQPILFYDGECGLCHRFVMFVLRHEQEPLFLFAPLQGDTFRQHFPADASLLLPDSIVLITDDGEMLTLSDAAVFTLRTLTPGWRRVGSFIGIFPRFARDLGYRFVAAVRKMIFKKPKEACPLVPAELRKRFLG